MEENRNRNMMCPEEPYETKRKTEGKFYFDPDKSYMAKLYADHITAAGVHFKEEVLDVVPEKWHNEALAEVLKREECCRKPTLEEQIDHIRGAIIELAWLISGGGA